MSQTSYIIGYGTFLLRSTRETFHLKPVEVIVVHGYKRLFHPCLPYHFPFILKAGKEQCFKGILFQIPENNLADLDAYEGVPKLYNRINYKAKSRFPPWFLYLPSVSTQKQLEADIEQYLTPEEQNTLFSSDLWLDYLRAFEPALLQEFPALFTF
ncbi:MAG: gamma-glutamylcyclotransferase family protein [Candidatus Helarchaeota archaeon]